MVEDPRTTTHDDQESKQKEIEQSFDLGFAHGGFGAQTWPAWNAYVNRDILDLFDEKDWIDHRDVLVPYFERVRQSAKMMRYPITAARKLGELLHHAIRLGLVVEDPNGPQGRGWRLIHRDPFWIVDGKGFGKFARQIRGLPPTQQIVEDMYQARLAKLNATLNRKARDKADDRIAALVAAILEADPDAVVPGQWTHQLRRRPSFLPALMLGKLIAGCAPVIREAHHTAGLDRGAVQEWISSLESFLRNTPYRLRERELRARLDVQRGIHAEIPADDTEALEALL